jgi:ATP-dependent Lhr-like helicase
VPALAQRLALGEDAVASALPRLEAQGLILRGRFSRAAVEAGALEWCDRDRLASIHRRTLGRLRRAIEPVATADWVRFLLRWQHLAPGTQLHGARGLEAVLSQLQGFHAPAGAWEAEVLRPRLPGYDEEQLDALCLGGGIAWGRFAWERTAGDDDVRPPTSRRPSRATPIAFAPRSELPWLLEASRGSLGPLAAEAAQVLELLDVRGALFVDEIERATGLSGDDVDDALFGLVAAGAITNDGFGTVRRLVRFGRRRELGAPRDGRWSILRTRELRHPPAPRSAFAEPEGWLEKLARSYLARWGVVFREVLARESRVPPWRDLSRVLRRLEDRGEIRAGRFVAGPSGEQFALPEAVESLRAVRRLSRDGRERVTVAAVDPLNLVGTIVAGARVPALAGHRVVFVDGAPEATAASSSA